MKNCISIIIPTKNGGELFRESLEMIYSQNIALQLEVIVIDSGSTDQTLQVCADYPVKLIRIAASSFNHSATRNLAISAAQGELCVLTVQDAVAVDRKWLGKLVAPLQNNKRVAGVFGQQVSRAEASPLSRCCKQLWYQEWKNDWDQESEQLPVASDGWKELSGEQKRRYARFDNVNSCIRKSVWKDIPFPDVSYAEDTAWAMGVLSAGFSVYWQPNAKVFHSHERSLAYEFKRSYVDTKTLSATFGESFQLISHHRARLVITWFAQEAERFQESSTRELAKKERSVWAIAEADDLWQQMNLAHDESIEEEKDVEWFRSCFYRCLLGPTWFRKVCRTILNKGIFFQRAPNVNSSGKSLFVLELQGRHRFFLNQLLRIYFAHNNQNANSVRLIRFGAAAMVGGSLLGQYMSSVDFPAKIDGGSSHLEDIQGRSMSATEGKGFWQAVDEWSRQQYNQESDALLYLDQLLTDGV